MDNYGKLNEALTVVKIARDALEKVDAILEKMRALTVRAAESDLGPTERRSIQEQINAYATAIDEITAAAELMTAEFSRENPGSNLLAGLYPPDNPFNKFRETIKL